MTFAVRTATPDDGPNVSGLLQKSYSVLLQDAYDADLLARALPLITTAQPLLLNCGTYYLAITRDGRVVGAGGWTPQSPKGAQEAAATGHIRHFATDPDFARLGIGRQLMDTCVSEATRAGLAELACFSTLNGEPFYATFGFRTVGRSDVELPGGIVFPSLRMVKTLA